MRHSLTARQKQALEAIIRMTQQRGCPPTIRELGQALGIKSTNGVRYLLAALERNGLIRRRPRTSRGIELIGEKLFPNHLVSIPLLGRVAAGEPVLAEENLEEFFFLDSASLTSGKIFALRVKGQSMREVGILDGDVVFARQQPTAQRGEIVVAIIGDEATVKRFYPENGQVRLEPANSDYGPIIVRKNAPGFRVAGKVIGLVRKIAK